MSSMIISTGGTGGHVIPAKVFYDYFKEKFNVKIISDKRGLNFIEKENYNVNEIHIPQFKKNFSILIFPFFFIPKEKTPLCPPPSTTKAVFLFSMIKIN